MASLFLVLMLVAILYCQHQLPKISECLLIHIWHCLNLTVRASLHSFPLVTWVGLGNISTVTVVKDLCTPSFHQNLIPIIGYQQVSQIRNSPVSTACRMLQWGLLLMLQRINMLPMLQQLHWLPDRSFAASTPRLWNTLPVDSKNSEWLNIFKSKVKTHLFGQCYRV